MEVWQAHYWDAEHDLNCVIENRYDEEHAEPFLRLYIDGTVFCGAGLDDWKLSAVQPEKPGCGCGKGFSLLQYGSGEQGDGDWLQDYTLQVNIPVDVFQITHKQKIKAELQIVLRNEPKQKHIGVSQRNDTVKTELNTTSCQQFALVMEGRQFAAEHPDVMFETSLQSICKQISGSYYLCTCFGCIYSDYSPYGQGNLGNLCCFAANKHEYLKVYSKYEGEYTIWDAFESGCIQCQETGICGEFAPRIDCLGGYRGTIY